MKSILTITLLLFLTGCNNYNQNLTKDTINNYVTTNKEIKEDCKILTDKKNKLNNSYVILVNKNNPLNKDYIPENLMNVNVYFPNFVIEERKNMVEEAGINLEKMFLDAKNESIYLAAISGYRSYESQNKIYNNNINTYGKEYTDKVSAKPGYSEHQTGLAMDISCERINYNLVEEFSDTPEGIWLNNNCYKYGFIIRYPEGKYEITGYIYEPWHIRYVGLDISTYLYENNLTLEEYLEGDK